MTVDPDAKAIGSRRLAQGRRKGDDPLTNLGQERVARVQIQRYALETAAGLAPALPTA